MRQSGWIFWGLAAVREPNPCQTLQYLLLLHNNVLYVFMTTWVWAFNSECVPVNANNRLTAFVIQNKDFWPLLFSSSCVCSTEAKQMNVCTVMAVHMVVPRIQGRTIHPLFSPFPVLVGCELRWELLLSGCHHFWLCADAGCLFLFWSSVKWRVVLTRQHTALGFLLLHSAQFLHVQHLFLSNGLCGD